MHYLYAFIVYVNMSASISVSQTGYESMDPSHPNRKVRRRTCPRYVGELCS